MEKKKIMELDNYLVNLQMQLIINQENQKNLKELLKRLRHPKLESQRRYGQALKEEKKKIREFNNLMMQAMLNLENKGKLKSH